MSQRRVLQVFEQYQNARTQFVQMVAELATRPQNIETLQNAGEPVGDSPSCPGSSHPYWSLTPKAPVVQQHAMWGRGKEGF